MIKAIETQLWGYAFRSRIEARWAVFFDRLGIEWQYETQGFMLPSGPYLPDFFLPGFGLWFEVKGQRADDEERERCRELSYSDYPVLLAEGPVGEKPLTLFCFGWRDDQDGQLNVECTIQAFIWRKDSLVIWPTRDCLSPENARWERILAHVSCMESGTNGWASVGNAVTAARSARFEHGQSPRRQSC